MTQVWPFMPDEQMDDIYEFFTDVMKAEAAEKRIVVRKNAQRSILLNHIFDDEAHALYRSIAKRVGSANTIYVPLWMNVLPLGQASQAQTVFNGNTIGLGFTEKCVVWSSYDDYEVLEITSVTDTSITANSGLTKDYSNCYIVPIREAYAINGFSVSRSAFNNYTASVTFKIVDDDDMLQLIPENASSITYEGIPLVPYRPTRMSNLEESILDVILEVDNGAGSFAIVRDLEHTVFNQTVEFNFQDRDKLMTIVRFFSEISGRSNPFWLPSYFNEIKLLNTANASCRVKAVLDRPEYVGKYVYIELKNGQKFLRKITAASLSFGDISITFDSPLGLSVTPDEVLQFCFMVPVRSDTDMFELKYSPGMTAITTFVTTEVSEI